MVQEYNFLIPCISNASFGCILVANEDEVRDVPAFSGFENHKQVSAYFGIAPTELTSGSSIRGRARISKRGNPAIRYQFVPM